MVLKRDFLRRLNKSILISFVVFLVFMGIFFYMSFQTKINAINILLNSLTGDGSIASLKSNINEMAFLFITQLITFVIAVIALLTSLWYTTQRYLVEKRNALVDSLTEIYNKKAILFHLKQELLRSERYSHPTTVAILDIDFFKKYNDTNGHVAGDRLLKRFAKILKDIVRKYDEIGRFGGEEFIIVFPETSIKDAAEVCERFRREIEATNFYGRQTMPNKKITVSVGLAEIKGKARINENTLLHKADEHLYKAKEQGRNRVIY